MNKLLIARAYMKQARKQTRKHKKVLHLSGEFSHGGQGNLGRIFVAVAIRRGVTAHEVLAGEGLLVPGADLLGAGRVIVLLSVRGAC